MVGGNELIHADAGAYGRVIRAHEACEGMLEQFLLKKAGADEIGEIAYGDIDRAGRHCLAQLDTFR